MGWGTSVTAEIYLSKQTFRSEYDLESHIEELKDELQNIRRRMSMATIADVKNIIPKDEEDTTDPLFYAERFVREELDRFQEVSVELYKCESILEVWRERGINEKEDFV